MSEAICKCGHSADEHSNHFGCQAAVNGRWCECEIMKDVVLKTAKITELKNDLKAVEANYDALQTPMACGHLARYAVNTDEGTGHCALCVLDATQVTIANLVNDDDDQDEKCPFCKTRATLKIVEKLLDSTPEIGAKHYDDVIANLINDVTSANSTFQCYCEENKNE